MDVDRDLYVLCLVMLRQQFDTRLKCFIIKKKSVLFRLKLLFFIEVVILTSKQSKSLIENSFLTFINI